MAYIGQQPVAGDSTSSFRLLDNIASYTLTFDGSSAEVVSVANNTLTVSQHRFVTAQRITYNDGGGTAIGGLSNGVYYVIKVDQNTIKIAASEADANNNVAIDLTSLGVGTTHTINVAFDGVNTKFKATYNNGTKAKLSRAGQLLLSINGVIQQPQETSTPTVGFGIDADSTIVFSTAPAGSDVVFGNIIANTLVTFDVADNDVDNFTGDGSTLTFNLSKSPTNNQNILVTLDGVVQYPSDGTTTRAYSVVESTLTFSSAPDNGVAIQVRHIGFAGATTSAVTGFYGRTGNVVLTTADDINVQNITGVAATFTGNVSVAGTLTYEDVTNVDSVGLITARSGIIVSSGSTSAPSIAPIGDTNTGIFFPSADTIAFAEGGAEAARIDSSGRLLVGTSSDLSNYDVQIANANGDGFLSMLSYSSTASNGVYVTLNHSKSGTLGTHGLVSSGDMLGTVRFRGSDGSSFVDSAAITAEVDGTPGANDMPGRLVFSTTADGASSPTERMRIDSQGRMGLGTTSPGALLHAAGKIRFGSNATYYGEIDHDAAGTGANIYNSQDAGGHNFQISGSEKARIDSSGRLLVGTSSGRTVGAVAGSIQIEGVTDTGLSVTNNSNGGAGDSTWLTLARTRGTAVGGTTAVSNNDWLGSLDFAGHNGSSFNVAARIIGQVDGVVSGGGVGDMPGRLVFSTTADGASTPTEHFRITQKGIFKFSTNGSYVDTSSSYNEIYQTNTSVGLLITNTNASPQGFQINYNTDSNGTSNEFIYCLGGATQRMSVRSNGGITNYSANNVNLCDEREKKNVESLDSTWGCLKNWELKKFHYNEDDDTDDKRYGVIAQQVAPHCPEVITDWVKQKAEDAVLDDDGNVVTPAREEIVRMGVKEQQMYWMAIKALQEAQVRIETLEATNTSQASIIAALDARLTALEGGN